MAYDEHFCLIGWGCTWSEFEKYYILIILIKYYFTDSILNLLNISGLLAKNTVTNCNFLGLFQKSACNTIFRLLTLELLKLCIELLHENSVNI